MAVSAQSHARSLTPTQFECRICGALDLHTRHRASERFYGTLEEFDYVECSVCGCLQIDPIPADLQKYYPRDYYAFVGPAEPQSTVPRVVQHLKRAVKRRLARESLAPGHRKIVSRLTKLRVEAVPWIARCGLSMDARILDVGCGVGFLVRELAISGFTRVKGIDPFVEKALRTPEGAVIEKKRVHDVEGCYDLIMMNHSLEHMPDPESALRSARERLSADGTLLVRVPLADSYARRHYGMHWVALDAPRHVHVFTRKGLTRLAHRCGFEVKELQYDSTALQFYGSEGYQRGYSMAESASLFSRTELAEFERRASILNEEQDGDCAGFYLKVHQPKSDLPSALPNSVA